jgi:4-hydroxyphenylpyruvate dioxygenase
MQQLATYPASTPTDFLPLKGIDHLEFYVGNAKQAAYFYRRAFGLALIAYRGPETGTRDRVSYVLEQNQIRFVLTTPLDPESVMAGHILRHGDGVKSIALTVDDATAAYRETTHRGALGVTSPTVLRDDEGEARLSSIAAYGNTVHTFVERANYRGAFLPGFVAVPGPDPIAEPTGLLSIDHTVGNVALGEMNKWVEFYERVLGFSVYQTFDDHDISTEYSSLMSKVVSNGGGWIKFPINEPAHGRKKSQIDEYLDAYRGPGVQHVALATDDIVFNRVAARPARSRVSKSADRVLRRSSAPYRPHRGTAGQAGGSGHSRRSRRGRISLANLHTAGGGPPHLILRDYPAQGLPRFWKRQLQSPLRID